ncbi:MAG: 5'/3'-nucleotidase SurE [Candidatus Latescibacteria bacterium]|nr:5'/3'-nucleotidase SurE [Candidatus Latescibacterota bacterium]
MKNTILLTNDDGFYAPGLQVLRKAIQTVWDTYVVAPESEQSAASHALSLNRPLRVKKIDSRAMVVDGTPADCVMLSLKGLLDITPDLVISGINSGANLGEDVIYSGTVAGATEAAILGTSGIAVSFVDPENTDYEYGAQVALKVAEAVLQHSLPEKIVLNVNIPAGWSGNGQYETTRLGRRTYREVIIEKADPRGKPYYWIGSQVDTWEGPDDCDFAAINRGNVSITPLQLDMTSFQDIHVISNWII